MTRPSPTRESPDASRVAKLARRPHRKSRNGCFNCKRRKVKCDEVKPACANCIRFGIPCDFAPHPAPGAPVALQAPENTPIQAGEPSALARRGPGRPRKDWAALARATPQTVELNIPSPPSAVTATAPAVVSSSSVEIQHCNLNVDDAELLLHYVAATARTLTDSDDAHDGLVQFWSYNVPKIGISYHFVLHLINALAGYHLAFSETSEDGPARHLSLAEHHASVGFNEVSRVLPTLNRANCGALYVSAMMICYCTFAAGPKSEKDLLVCDLRDGAPQRFLPSIHGVRFIRQTFEPAALFTGLMAPFGGTEARGSPDHRPSYLRDGFSRVDWLGQLDSLQKWIASHESPDTIIYSRSLKSLSDVYEATYGDETGSYSGSSSSQSIFGWLYRMQDPFVACLRREEPLALIILAHYAPLLKTLKKFWFVHGWTEHLLRTIGDMIRPELDDWLHWPREISQRII